MKVDGTARLLRKLDQLPAMAQRKVSDALEASASDLHSHATRKIQASGSVGRTYVRGTKTHVASAPGAYPNSDHGELVRSMGSRLVSALSAIFYAGARHARPLEMGTSRMAARPFMRPTLKAMMPRIKARVNAAVAAAIRSVAHGR